MSTSQNMDESLDMPGVVVTFLISSIFHAISKTAAAPMERVKLLIQNQDEMLRFGRLTKPYTGVFDCLKRIITEEGTASLWRGNTANIIRYFLTQALNFAFRDTYKYIFAFTEWWMLGSLASGAAAGATSLLFIYPLDYVRTRLASDVKNAGSSERQFKGVVDVLEKTLNSDGVAGLYRGFLPSVIGIVVYRGLYLGIYDFVRPFVTGSLEGNFFATFLLGWSITTAASLASYPFDTIRSRLMMGSGETVRYRSFIDTGGQILAQEGVTSLWKGAGADIIRGVSGAITLSAFNLGLYLIFG